jgi:uncharacterized protein (TIGR03437 family)
MSFRKGALQAGVCLLALASVAPAQNQYIAFHSGAGNSSTELYVYLAGLLQPVSQLRTVSGGTFQILPLPDGTKYYLIANGGAAITAVEGNFINPRTIASGFAAAPTFATVQPDGRRLIVAAGRVYFLDTSTDTVINPNGLVVDGEPIDVAVSFDSSKAFILSRSNPGTAGTVLTVIDLVNNFARLGVLTFNGNQSEAATGLTMGPNGYLYLSAYARVYEISTDTFRLSAGGELAARGYPSRGTLTPDGKYIVFPNRQPVFGGNSVMQLDLSTRTFSYDGASTSEIFTKFTPASPSGDSPTKLYGYGTTGRLYDITLGSQVILDRSQLVARFQSGLDNVIFPNLSFSNEVPPRTLWYTRPVTNLDGSTSKRIVQAGLSSFDQNIQEQNLPFTQNLEMTFLSPGVTSGGTRILGYNTTQTVPAASRTGLPLVARIVDALGRPIYRGQITFSSTDPAVIVQNPQSVTGIDGWAQTFVTVPNAPGTYTVTASGGQNVTTVDYTITVPGVAGPGGGVSQGGIYIVSGNGQLTRENFPLAAPLNVVVLDASGNPLPGQKVVWTLVRGTGNLGTVETTTGQDGQVLFSYTTGRVPVPAAANQDVIEASTTFGKVTFYTTTLALNLPIGTLAGDAQIEYIYPNLGDLNNRNLTVEAGGLLPAAIGIRVADYLGQPLENVGLDVQTSAPPIFSVDGFSPPIPPAGFTARCDGAPLTDSRGNVYCDIRAGNTPGTGSLYVIVGSYRAMATLNLTITVGRASRLRVLAGDAQKARANTALPIPLQVQVTDLGGNPINNFPVTWSIVAPGTGTLGAARTVTNPGGIAQNSFRTGITPGRVQIRAQIDNPVAGGNPIFVVFNVDTETTLGGLIQISGNGQETGINNEFPNPLVVQVNDISGQPLPGVRVEFAAIGAGTIITSSEVTNVLGQAATRVRASGASGTVAVTATTGSFQTTFTLTVRPPTPTILGSNIVNSASLQPGLTPCGLATLTGSNLLPGMTGLLQPNSIGQLPTTLGPIDGITISGISAPIVRVLSQGGVEQVDIQTPCEVPLGPAAVVVSVRGQSPAVIQNVPVQQYQPGIFEFDGNDGRRYAIAIKDDGSFVGPSNPAERGKTVRVLLTGLGQTSPALATNRAGIANQGVTANLIGGINDAGVRVVRAETVQGQIGNYLVELEIPADTFAGPYQSLAVAVVLPGGQLVFSNGSYIPIR